MGPKFDFAAAIAADTRENAEEIDDLFLTMQSQDPPSEAFNNTYDTSDTADSLSKFNDRLNLLPHSRS